MNKDIEAKAEEIEKLLDILYMGVLSCCDPSQGQIPLLREYFRVTKLDFAEALKQCNTWISVEDELPELTVNNYLVLVDGVIIQAYYNSLGEWCDENTNETYNYLKPTHWMPLPSPPKAEGGRG